jgi:hypothetical protein
MIDFRRVFRDEENVERINVRGLIVGNVKKNNTLFPLYYCMPGLYMTTLYPVICRWYTFLYAGPTYSYMSVLHTLKCQSFILQYVHAIYCYMPIANPFILWYAGLIYCYFPVFSVWYGRIQERETLSYMSSHNWFSLNDQSKHLFIFIVGYILF